MENEIYLKTSNQTNQMIVVIKYSWIMFQSYKKKKRKKKGDVRWEKNEEKKHEIVIIMVTTIYNDYVLYNILLYYLVKLCI